MPEFLRSLKLTTNSMTTSTPTILILGATDKVSGEAARLLAKNIDIHVIDGVCSFEKVKHF